MQGKRTTERTVKIELLSQWTLEAEFRNYEDFEDYDDYDNTDDYDDYDDFDNYDN